MSKRNDICGKKKARTKLFVLNSKLTSLSCAFSCSLAFAFFCNARFVVGFFSSDITDNAVFLALSLEAFERAFKTLILTNFNRCQLYHHLLGPEFYLSIIFILFAFVKRFCRLFSQLLHRSFLQQFRRQQSLRLAVVRQNGILCSFR